MSDQEKLAGVALECASWHIIKSMVRSVAFVAGIVLLVMNGHDGAAIGLAFLYLVTE